MSLKRLYTLSAIVVLGFAGIALLKWFPASTQLIWQLSAGGTRLFPLITVSALIDSINPCAFSILLITMAFLLTLGTLRSKMLKIGAAYILGIFLAYLLIGLGIVNLLHLFDTPHFMGKVGAVILVAFGLLNLVKLVVPSFPVRLGLPKGVHHKIAELMEKTSLPAAFLLGGLVGLCEFPCTGGPYLMALGLLHDSQTYLRGATYLLWYNVLFVLPLVVILLIASDAALIEKLQQWKNTNIRSLQLITGIAMVILGAAFFSF